MRFRFFIGIFFLLVLKESESATTASCKLIVEDWPENDESNELTTCWPNITVVEDFTISTKNDSSVMVIAFSHEENLKFLPKNLQSNFPQLVVFHAWNCSLTSVGSQFKGLSKLMHLRLAKNKIENVAGDAFVDLVNLEALDLAHNRIQILGRETFASLKALKKLSIHNNEISTLHPGIFDSLVNVEDIDLDNNEIQDLDENIFGNLINVKNIYLSNNKLTKIPMGLFREKFNLENIWLSGNKIKIIDGTMFNHLRRNLLYVDLEGNECVNRFYHKQSFSTMRTDLKTNCSENVGK